MQRYGPDVTGGSESLARAVAEHLTDAHEVTVLTSCARDYVSWRSELPEGTSILNGVEVLRFPVEETRDLDAFNAFSEPLYTRATTREEELDWLRRQGPYVPKLVAHLQSAGDRYAAVLFFTYLYYPTYWGLREMAARSVLVPTAHDEPPLRFSIYRDVFETPRAMAFCSAPEEALVRSRFQLRGPTAVAGIGIEVPERPDVQAFKKRYEVRAPYVLYAGRIDAGKGCAEMLEFFRLYREDAGGTAELLLIGNQAMDIRAPGARYLGYLSEAEKFAAMAGARAIVCPSPMESLSIVLLEAFALGVPALANARSPVLKDHCIRSNAGLFYETGPEFVAALDLLMRSDHVAGALGQNGRRYVAEHYRWPMVTARYRELIEAVRKAKAADEERR